MAQQAMFEKQTIFNKPLNTYKEHIVYTLFHPDSDAMSALHFPLFK